MYKVVKNMYELKNNIKKYYSKKFIFIIAQNLYFYPYKYFTIKVFIVKRFLYVKHK